MKQIFLVLRREYLTRVKKKSFLLATILTPLIFPALIGLVIFLGNRDSGGPESVYVLDQSGFYNEKFSDDSYTYTYLSGDLENAKQQFQDEGAYGLLYIPEISFDDASKTFYDEFEFYSKSNTGVNIENSFERQLRNVLEQVKLDRSGLDPDMINSLQANVNLNTYNLSDTGEAQESNSGLNLAVGYIFGFLIYMFIFIYGGQIMQSVLDEKTSRIVEVIVSSVRPFQLMMGKVLGIGAVGVTQLLIWVALMTTLTTVGFSVFGPSAAADMAGSQMPAEAAVELTSTQEQIANIQNLLDSVPIVTIVVSFIFYYLGAYFLYGAMYAAIGSAVDSLQDAQQFMFPIMIPLIISIVSLSMVIQNPDSQLSFWLSMIPFTSPVVMMGRIPFGVPLWELLLSMTLLIAGFVFMIWVAGRIYRVGILMYGVKVNWKTLKVWFTTKV